MKDSINDCQASNKAGFGSQFGLCIYSFLFRRWMKETWGILIVITHKPTTKSREGKHSRCGFSTMKEEHGEREEETAPIGVSLLSGSTNWGMDKNEECCVRPLLFLFLFGWVELFVVDLCLGIVYVLTRT